MKTDYEKFKIIGKISLLLRQLDEQPKVELDMFGEPIASPNKTLDVTRVDVKDIKVDPKAYQFRSEVGHDGTDKRLNEVKAWDDLRAGVMVIHERHDGQQFIADGHHRIALAKKLGVDGVNAFVLKESEGHTVDDAKSLAALVNLANNNGTGVDAAKLFRSNANGKRPEQLMEDLNLPKNQAIKTGVALAKLSDDVFGSVVNGVIEERDGAVIGDTFSSPEEQQAALKQFMRVRPANQEESQVLAQQIKLAGFSKAQASDNFDLFGSELDTDSLLGERTRLIVALGRAYKKDKTLFETLGINASKIEQAGNQLDKETNSKLSNEATVMQSLLGEQIYTNPKMKQVLDQYATELKDHPNGMAAILAKLKQALPQVVQHTKAVFDEGGDDAHVFALIAEASSLLSTLNADDADFFIKLLRLQEIIQALNGAHLSNDSTHTDVAPLPNANTEETEPPETDLIGDVDDGLSDHYQDDNYRFKDVGYIAGARKEKAQLAIMQAKKSGQLVSVTDIDWDALEDDSRMAAATIIKKNVFGQVDWDALKDGGMNGNVGYFIKRLYAAVELQPDDDSPEGRKLYVTAIQNLRQLFESCQTMDDAVREIVALSKLLNTHRNMIKGEDGKATLNYDSQVANALGKKFKSWVFKTGNKAIHESRVMANDDWSWLEKSDKPTVSKPKKQGFQLEAASHIQRVGGTEVSIQSTEQFKDAFGLKAIQSGNWVLKDKESIEFHIQRAAESMLDMADVTGIAPELLGFGGRLGLAFGARGKGGALAHYEPVARVINITKMKGGGSLGHEYFHALDNLIQDLVTQQNNGKAGFFATETPHLLPESLTKNAFVTLRTVMLEGNESLTETLKLTDKDFRASAYNMKPEFLERSEVKRNIAAAGNVWDAVLVVDAHFARTRSPRPTRSSNHMDFVKIAAAHYADRNAEFVSIPSLEKGSRFLQDALLLDDFKRGKYWSKPLEMAARAYSSYLQDKLEQQGRTNDYLAYSTKGGNGRVGEEAYPQGKERERIHAAFDDLFKAIKDEQVFEKAVGNKDLMDSVFGEDAELDDLDVLDVIEEEAEA
ncbi:hypothetical protein FK216_12095 [Moraxellaceae bacterium AER2_44_116]|nr:hypothetical protein FK216_12095 [Moraxellaceae bacterium AER2_44_116]